MPIRKTETAAVAPVKVTLNAYTYRSTIASMGTGPCIPLRRSNREAAGLDGNETLNVTLELDADKREIQPPADFVRALKAKGPAWDRWRELSYSHQREHVEAIEEAGDAGAAYRGRGGGDRRETAEVESSRAGFCVAQPRRQWESDLAPERESASLEEARTRGRSVNLDSKPGRARPPLNAAWHESHPMPEKPDHRAAAVVAPGPREELRVPMPAKLRALLR